MLPVAIAIMKDSGDKDYLTSLYEKHAPLMMYLAMKIVQDRTEAEDVVQSAVVKLVRYVRKLRGMSEPQVLCYIGKTVKSVALDLVNNKRRQPPGEWVEDQADDHDGPEQAYIRMESYDELGRAIASLGERDQDLLYFKYFLDLPNDEICAALGISGESIWSLLHRARKRALCALEGRAGK